MNDPAEARMYIENFSRWIAPGSEFIECKNGKIIHFANMTDEEALIAVSEIAALEICYAQNRDKNLDH